MLGFQLYYKKFYIALYYLALFCLGAILLSILTILWDHGLYVVYILVVRHLTLPRMISLMTIARDYFSGVILYDPA